MKRVEKARGRKKPRKKAEPLAEGIIPLNGHGHRDWNSMSDGELEDYARRVIEKKGLKRRTELHKADSGLYIVLRRRGLLDRTGLESKSAKARDWASMSDDEIVAYALRVVGEKGLNSRNELQRADSGLYSVLWRRKLLDAIDFEKKKREQRNWVSMSDEELVGYAQEVIEERGMQGRKELCGADSGLYYVLWKRGLLDRIGFEKKRRDWATMSDEEIVEYARRIVDERGITGKSELQKADSGLYVVLSKRRLLDRFFAPIESQRKREAVQQVVDAMKEFGA